MDSLCDPLKITNRLGPKGKPASSQADRAQQLGLARHAAEKQQLAAELAQLQAEVDERRQEARPSAREESLGPKGKPASFQADRAHQLGLHGHQRG